MLYQPCAGRDGNHRVELRARASLHSIRVFVNILPGSLRNSRPSTTDTQSKHGTRRTAHYARRTAHGTRHTAHGTRRMGHSTRHTAHGTRHTGHLPAHGLIIAEKSIRRRTRRPRRLLTRVELSGGLGKGGRCGAHVMVGRAHHRRRLRRRRRVRLLHAKTSREPRIFGER